MVKHKYKGEEMRDYQQKKLKPYVMPEAVYRQALWAAKDMARLRQRMEDLNEKTGGTSRLKADAARGRRSGVSDPTYREAEEYINLSMRVECIERALTSVPAQYREGISRRLFRGEDYGAEYGEENWKKWQQVYLYHVAVNLRLI